MFISDLLTSIQQGIDILYVSSTFGEYKVGLLFFFLDLALFIVEGDCLLYCLLFSVVECMQCSSMHLNATACLWRIGIKNGRLHFLLFRMIVGCFLRISVDLACIVDA